MTSILDTVKGFTPFVTTAVAVLAVGVLLIYFVLRMARRWLKSSKIEAETHYFIISVIRLVLLGLLVMTCLSILKVPLTPVITAIGAAGLALSLALQSSLSNLAGGVFLLFNRPFAMGDFIELNGISGTVKEIRLIYTVIRTIDNRNIYMPNGDFSKAVITNYSAEPTRRLDLEFGVRAGKDIEKARDIIRAAVKRSGMALSEPEPIIRVSGQTYMTVTVSCLVWVERTSFFELKDYLIGNIRREFSENGLDPGINK